MVVKTNCQSCGKKNAIKNAVTFTPGDCFITTVHGCHKCGWKPGDPTCPVEVEPTAVIKPHAPTPVQIA